MKTKNTLLLFFFLFFYSYAFCQVKILQLPFYNDSATDMNMQVHHVFNEKDSSLSLTLFNKDNIARYYIQGNAIQTKFTRALFNEDNKPDSSNLQKALLTKIYGSKYIGGNLDGDYLEEYYLDGSYKHIITLLTDLRNEQTIISDTINLVRKERFVTAFSQGENFYFIGYINNSNIIRIYKKPFGKRPISHEKNIVFGKEDLNGEWWEPVTRKLSDLSDFFKSTYAVIQNGKNYPLGVTSAQYKIYISPNKLLLTSDNQYHRTLTIAISLEDLSYKIKKFEQPGIDTTENLDKMGSSTNSVVLDSLLIQTNVLNGRFNLSFVNRETGAVYKIYSEKSGQEPDIINGDILKAESDTKTYGKNDSSVTSFKKLIKKIKQNQIGLSAIYQHDTLKLTIGSQYEKRSITPEGIILSAALSAFGTFAINAMPNTVGFAIFSFWNESANNTMSFQSLFDKQTFAHLDGSIEKDSLKNSILQFIQKNNIQKENTFLTQSMGHYYLGYYSKEENDFVVYMF